MSSRDWRFRVQDILRSIQKIELYIEGMTAGQFKKNELVIDAVVRNLEIIGEASKNIPLDYKTSLSKCSVGSDEWNAQYFNP